MKYQGGYQIIDLSGDNIYAKAKSAFETNKPVLVYDGGIASFGNVTKDSTYFVVNYIIDDKLYQATIAADDTITKTNIDLGDSSSDIEAIEERLDANIMHASDVVDFSTATIDEPYTATHDGYAFMKIVQSSTSTDNGGYYILDPGTPSAQAILERRFANPGGDVFSSVFVKKGMRLAVRYNDGSNNEFKFVPLVNE